MQVVGRGDDHGVDVLASQHFGEVRHLDGFLAGELLDVGGGLLALLPPGVAHRRDFDLGAVLDLDQLLQQSAPPAADVGHAYAVVGAGARE